MKPLIFQASKTNGMYQKLLLPVSLIMCSVWSNAQVGKDTTKKQSINIVSSYKPVLRNAVKINFSGSHLHADTLRNVKEYNIPSQNLFYAYEAISIKPLAIIQDTNLYLGNRNYIKAGFGNYTTPYVNAGLGLGDGKVYLANAYVNYISSNGNIRNQDYSKFDVKVAGSYFLDKHEIYASLGTSRDEYYLYGYDHANYFPQRKDIRQQFQQINISGGVRNTLTGEHGINYNPNIKANFFTNINRLSETTVIIDAPVEKAFGDNIIVKLDANVDLTKYSTKNLLPVNAKITNNVEQLAASVVYHTDRIKVNGGIIPLWNNGKFEYLPNIFAEAHIKENAFILQAGWVGRIIKNTYRNLTEVNPYLSTLTEQKNTQEIEFYSGIKASIGKHFNLNAKVGFLHYKNFALYVNDTSAAGANENRFNISYEPTMHNVQIHGDISYINQDKFTASAGLTFNGYTGLNVNDKAWNTVPMEFNGSIHWWPFEQLMVKADFYMFGGGKYLGSDGKDYSFSGGSDLSAGVEYKINRQFSAFFDVNNIFNNKYERWHNYQVYGVNILGGVVFRF